MCKIKDINIAELMKHLEKLSKTHLTISIEVIVDPVENKLILTPDKPITLKNTDEEISPETDLNDLL
jgi:hypothetical protein